MSTGGPKAHVPLGMELEWSVRMLLSNKVGPILMPS
jgi:hypothetical protein